MSRSIEGGNIILFKSLCLIDVCVATTGTFNEECVSGMSLKLRASRNVTTKKGTTDNFFFCCWKYYVRLSPGMKPLTCLAVSIYPVSFAIGAALFRMIALDTYTKYWCLQ